MSRRTQTEWLNLIHAFEASDLSQTEFCLSQGINAKYFSKRKNELKLQTTPSPFVRVRCEAPPSMSVRLTHHDTCVQVSDCSPRWLATLLRELHA